MLEVMKQAAVMAALVAGLIGIGALASWLGDRNSAADRDDDCDDVSSDDGQDVSDGGGD